MLTALFLAAFVLMRSESGPPLPVELVSFRSPGSAAQIQFSPEYGLLFVRTGTTAVRVIEVGNQSEINVRQPTEQFTDMSLTRDGRFLFVADFGGEEVGARKPKGASLVHRYDAAARTWHASEVDLAYRIEAVDGSTFLLQTQDQWVHLSLYKWGAPAQQTARLGAGSNGDFLFHYKSSRAIHVSTGTSDHRVMAIRVAPAKLTENEQASYRDMRLFGKSCTMSSDGRHFFVDAGQFDPMDVKKRRRVFPESIVAASPRLAFGQKAFYDIDSGQKLGELGFEIEALTVSADGKSLWTMQAEGEVLKCYALERGYTLPAAKPAHISGSNLPKPLPQDESPVDLARRYSLLLKTSDADAVLSLMDIDETARRSFGPAWDALSEEAKELVSAKLGSMIKRQLNDPVVLAASANSTYSNFEATLEDDLATVTFIVRNPNRSRQIHDLYLKRFAQGWRIIDRGDESASFAQTLGTALRQSGRTLEEEAKRW